MNTLEIFQKEVTPYWGIWDIKSQTALLNRWQRAINLHQDRSKWAHCQLNKNNVEEYTIRATSGKQAGYSAYTVTVLSCTCPDTRSAPWGWCKHRLAVWIDSNTHRTWEPTPAQIEETLADLFGGRR